MTPVEIEPDVAASELPQSHDLDLAVAEMYWNVMQMVSYNINLPNILELF